MLTYFIVGFIITLYTAIFSFKQLMAERNAVAIVTLIFLTWPICLMAALYVQIKSIAKEIKNTKGK